MTCVLYNHVQMGEPVRIKLAGLDVFVPWGLLETLAKVVSFVESKNYSLISSLATCIVYSKQLPNYLDIRPVSTTIFVIECF